MVCELKTCSGCGVTKKLDCFVTSLKRGKPYCRSRCKECCNIQRAARRKDPVALAAEKAQQRTARQRPEFKARAREAHRAYYREHSDEYRQRARVRKVEFWAEKLIHSAKSASRMRTARGRNCPVLIGEEYISSLWEKQGGLCYFTGLRMTKELDRLDTVSIDRLDPSLGYEPGNVVLATKAANFAKSGHSESEFREYLDKVADSILSNRKKSVA